MLKSGVCANKFWRIDMAEEKRLRRPQDDRVIAGVCSGLGDYFGLDPVLVRVLFALATFFTSVFPGVLVYIILWIVMPEESAG
jgi:phage shock protein C